MKNSLKEISNTTTENIFEEASGFAEKIVDISRECEQIRQMNPTEVYHLKNEIIRNSKEISDERKIELLDENQDKLIKDNEKSVGIIKRIMSDKVVITLTALYGTFKIAKFFVSKYHNDDGDDNDLSGGSEAIPCQDYSQ